MANANKDVQLIRNAENIQLVREMLTLVGADDLPSALNLMTEDVDWQSPVTNTVTEPVSWSGPRRGRMEVNAFFEELYSKIRAFEMTILSYTAQDDRVIVEGTMRGVVESTEKEYRTNWVMVITIRDRKISRFRNYYDTAELVKAFQPAKETRKAA